MPTLKLKCLNKPTLTASHALVPNSDLIIKDIPKDNSINPNIKNIILIIFYLFLIKSTKSPP